MSQYKVLKTTMGRKYRMRMSEDEIAERDLFRLAVIGLPFLASVLMTILWIKGA